MSVQPLRGLVPMSAGIQVPTLPAAAQVRHGPSQAVLQQTPSEQKPEAHVAPPPGHAFPIAIPPVPEPACPPPPLVPPELLEPSGTPRNLP